MFMNKNFYFSFNKYLIIINFILFFLQMKISEKKKAPKKTISSNLQGIPKWIKEYRDRFSIDLDQLEQTSRECLAQTNSKSNGQSQTNLHSNDNEDDDTGWTVVSRSLKRTRQRMIPSTNKTLNRLRAKHKHSNEKKELVNFYKFQMTDKKVDHLEQLKLKFELDKQRITQMRQQRKFKPF
jgi:ribosomal RNA-processing protein 7